MLSYIRNESLHFKSLPQKAQNLIVSFFFMSVSYPILGTFMNAFIFKNTNNILVFILYFLGQFTGLTLAFFLNGILLKKINIKYLYFVGTFLLGIITLLMVFFVGHSFKEFFIYGIIFGIGGGLHWGNRNYITLNETHEKNRNYFVGLNYSLDILTSVMISFVVGWLLVWGLSYQALMSLVFIFLFISGYIILKSDYQSPSINRLEIKKPTKKWWAMRIFQTGIGISEGIIFFISSFLILSRIGNEGILGTLSSISSMLGAAFIYTFGRKTTKRHQLPIFIISLFVAILASTMFVIFFDSLSTLVYILISGLVLNFMWLVAGPLIMNQIDIESKKIEGEKYAYIFDGEAFLNVGRSFSLILSLFMIFFFGQDFFLRFSPLIMYSILAIIMTFIIKPIS